MIRLYRGHRIKVVRMGETLPQHKRRELGLHYRITRLCNNAPVAEGGYPAGWTIWEALADLRGLVDLKLGVLENERHEFDLEAEMSLEEGDG